MGTACLITQLNAEMSHSGASTNPFVLNYKICPKFSLTVMIEIVNFEFSGCTFLMGYLLLEKRGTDAVYVQ